MLSKSQICLLKKWAQNFSIAEIKEAFQDVEES